MSRISRIGIMMSAFLLIAACSHMTPREQRALSGGAIGAAGGAAVGAIAGAPALGAALGGAGGAAIGAFGDPDFSLDSHRKK